MPVQIGMSQTSRKKWFWAAIVLLAIGVVGVLLELAIAIPAWLAAITILYFGAGRELTRLTIGTPVGLRITRWFGLSVCAVQCIASTRISALSKLIADLDPDAPRSGTRFPDTGH